MFQTVKISKIFQDKIIIRQQFSSIRIHKYWRFIFIYMIPIDNWLFTTAEAFFPWASPLTCGKCLGYLALNNCSFSHLSLEIWIFFVSVTSKRNIILVWNLLFFRQPCLQRHPNRCTQLLWLLSKSAFCSLKFISYIATKKCDNSLMLNGCSHRNLWLGMSFCCNTLL